MDTSLNRFVESLFGGEDDVLRQARERAQQNRLPLIQVPTELGRLLQFLILATRTERILEIGTLFGYSSTIMARVLPPSGHIVSLEMEPAHADAAQRTFHAAGVADRVEIRQGPALETLAAMTTERFDMTFIDADKAAYPDYLGYALRYTRPGGIIVADNVWRGGAVAAPPGDDPNSQGVVRFLEGLRGEASLYSIIVPTKDGADAASVSWVRPE